MVDTLYYAGNHVAFVDIDPITLCIDWKGVYANISTAVAIIAVHTYGIDADFDKEFAIVRNINPKIALIDDRCLCLPKIGIQNSTADLILYSTGEKKQVDLGKGGIGYVADGWRYEDVSVLPNDVLTNEYWNLDLDVLNYQCERVLLHKQRLNAIYFNAFSSPPPSHTYNILSCSSWRFNILVPNKQEILQAIFEAGLFASGHYAPQQGNYPNARWLYEHIINLFNDFYFTEKQAISICAIIQQKIRIVQTK